MQEAPFEMKLKAKAKVYFFLSSVIFAFFDSLYWPQFFKFLSFCQRFSLLTTLNAFFQLEQRSPTIIIDNSLDNN